MTFLSSLISWANVPFVIAFGVAVLFVALQLTGLLGLLAGGGDHEGDADHEADADGSDADGDADADADGGGADHHGDADHEGDADHDGDADQDADQDHDQGASAGKGLLAGMGVGTMPLSIVWQAFAMCFALGGITTNTIYFMRTGDLPLVALAWSAPIALVFAYGTTRLVSKVFARLAPNPGKAATSRKDLVGRTGVVISSKVSDEFGEVRVTDPTGIVHRIICRTMKGEEVIPEGREAVFVEYDRERDVLYVAPFDIDAPPTAARLARRRSRTAPAHRSAPPPGRTAAPPPARIRAEAAAGTADPPGEPLAADVADAADAGEPEQRSKAAP